MLLATAFSASMYAQRSTDIENSKDHPMVSRFEGAVIEFYKETKWGAYKIPVSENKISFCEPLVVEGKVIRTQYSVSIDNNPEYVLQNYKAAFAKAGFTILIAVANEGLGVGERSQDWAMQYYSPGDAYWRCALNNTRFGGTIGIPNWKGNQAFIVAKGQKGNKEIYVTMYSIDNNAYTLINQDVIEIQTAETGMVTAENISKGINAEGHFAVYGILFETGQSTIKPESSIALKTISDFINANAAKKYYIVGHTDNVGNFPDNRLLSDSRAKTVMNELITNYAVKPEQLKAYGTSSLSPVTSNATEEGRAKNRRVEIVEQ